MNTIEFLRRALPGAALALCMTAGARAQTAEAGGPAPAFLKTPYLQNVRTDAIVVMWETNVPCDSVVRYGENGKMDREAASRTPTTVHEVEIAGLREQTAYAYQAESCGMKSAPSSFAAAPRKNTPFRFAVWGDNRTDPVSHGKVAAGIARSAPDIAVNVGDVVTNGEVYEQWSAEYFGPMSVFSHRAPTFIAIGNHEKNSPWFYKFVSQPGPENYFAFTYGDARFVVLDTNQPIMTGAPQYEWLKKELKSESYRSAKWHFAFFHHPLYSEGWDAPGYNGEASLRIYLEPLFKKNRMDIVFQGHTHDYERGRYSDVNYVITGGGGSGLDVFQQNFDQTTVFHSRYQYCAVDVEGDRVVFTARDYETDEIFDYLELKKEGVEPHAVAREGAASM